MTSYTNIMSQLGYFLDFSYWRNAISLLDYQLLLKPDNKHYNTLSMFYYENLPINDKAQICDETYFSTRVANNLLYGLEKEFAIHAYPIPKSNLGLREYRFFTYPMRIAYYSLGVYLLKLSQELILQYYQQFKHIHSNYGGSLLFDESVNLLKLTYDSVWYKPHYQRFRKRVRKEVSGDTDNKIVIHMDIQNYFEEISIPTLLEFLTENIKPSLQKGMRFDPITKGQITDFFSFMANGHSGIPQTDNDVISSFIGHLYLVFGDLLIDQEIQQNYAGVIKEHSIIRYVDDMYICLSFEEIPNTEKEIYISSLASRIADCLYQRLGLRLNTKTKLYWLNLPAEKENLLKNLKRVSPNYDLSDEENKNTPQEKVDLIFYELDKLKKSSLEPTFNARGDLNEEILKEVYNKSVSQLLRKKDNLERISRIFENFNYDLVIAQPREILIVLLIDKSVADSFKRFLISKQNLTSRDVHLILSFLCQTDFQSNELIERLQSTDAMKHVVEVYLQNTIPTKVPGYFALDSSQILKMADAPNVIEQIRLRVQSERRNEYSVALNHLLNEIHAICFKLDGRKINEKDYDASKVAEFLSNKRVPHVISIKIRNLFDRRNKNPVSHADPIAWPVSKIEYVDYLYNVGLCLNYLL